MLQTTAKPIRSFAFILLRQSGSTRNQGIGRCFQTTDKRGFQDQTPFDRTQNMVSERVMN
jgi:hypothetical protein